MIWLWHPSYTSSASPPQPAGKPAGDKLAIRLGPAHGNFVATEKFLRRKRIYFYTETQVLTGMGSQDGFTHTARTAVNEQDELLFSKTSPLERLGIKDVFHGLNLGEVVAATDCAAVGVEFRGLQACRRENFTHVFVPRMFRRQCGGAPP